MVQNIIQYPTPLSLEYAVDVRNFDEKLFALIEDLKDTIKANNLEGLSAFQIGQYYNVVVLKDEQGGLLELINPRMIAHSGTIETFEQTTYFPNKKAKITRYETIKVVYQDRHGKDQVLEAHGQLAVVAQRKIDYTFGATFLLKMDPKERQRFESQLDSGTDIGYDGYCPTTFVRDYFLRASNGLLLLMVGVLIYSFFKTSSLLWDLQIYGAIGVVLFVACYFLYGQYEAKKYKSCSSCQIGNLIGTSLLTLFKLALVMIVSYFVLM